jgi:hypothetical protein
VHAATCNKGGGKAGHQDRLGGAVGHARYRCSVCMLTAPSMKNMEVRSSGGGGLFSRPIGRPGQSRSPPSLTARRRMRGPA